MDIVTERTKRDRNLRDLYNKLRTGDDLSDTPFKAQEAEFSLQTGCVINGISVLIPKT